MPTEYKIPTKVRSIEERSRTLGCYRTGEVDGSGKPIYATKGERIGWFVHFEGSRESLFLGADDRPRTVDGKPVVAGMDAEIIVRFR